MPTKKIIDVLRHCIERNLVKEEGKDRPAIRKDNNFKTRQQNATNPKCVFCDGTVHNEFAK